MRGVDLNRKELGELKDFIVDEIEAIVFSTRRNREKVKGGYYIEDDTGKLRESIKRNRSKHFIKSDGRGGIIINFKVIDYFKYLDDKRERTDLNWYLTEAIFDSDNFNKKLKEVYAKAMKRIIIDEIQLINKNLN
jgi:hypothetical protein